MEPFHRFGRTPANRRPLPHSSGPNCRRPAPLPRCPAPSAAVQPGTPPRRPDGQDGAAQTGTPPEYGGAFPPASHTRPKSSKMTFTSPQLTTFARNSAPGGRLGGHMPTCLRAAALSRLHVYMPRRSRVESPTIRHAYMSPIPHVDVATTTHSYLYPRPHCYTLTS